MSSPRRGGAPKACHTDRGALRVLGQLYTPREGGLSFAQPPSATRSDPASSLDVRIDPRRDREPLGLH